MSGLETLSLLLVAFLVVGAWVVDHVREEPSELEQLQQRRVAEDISQEEYERRLDVLLDDEADRIKASVEPIPGIGPARSTYLAERYDSLDDLRQADVEELEQLPDVGEQRAQAIKERLS